MKQFIIVGGGISGCTAAFTLAELGNAVTVVEQQSVAGGKVLDYCCKATDSCSRCGVCVAHTQISDTVTHPNISLITGAEIISSAAVRGQTALKILKKNPSIDYSACEFCGECVSACPENCITRYQRGELVQFIIDYEKCRLHKGKSCDACIKACPACAISADNASTMMTLTGDDVLIATGHTLFPAEQKPRYGYSRSDKIITGAEAEALLSGEFVFGDNARDIAFIQCVGSRDPVIGRNYCSAVCCSYAMRLARILKYRDPDINLTIYYIDLQNFDKEFTRLKAEIEDLGVVFRRGLPFRIDELANGKLRFMIENMNGEETLVEHDFAVLSVGMGPDKSAGQIAETFGLQQDENGFFVSSESGIFSIGTCREPGSIPDSMTEARSAAAQMVEALMTEAPDE